MAVFCISLNIKIQLLLNITSLLNTLSQEESKWLSLKKVKYYVNDVNFVRNVFSMNYHNI